MSAKYGNFVLLQKIQPMLLAKSYSLCHGESYGVAHICKILCWVKHIVTNVGGGGHNCFGEIMVNIHIAY